MNQHPGKRQMGGQTSTGRTPSNSKGSDPLRAAALALVVSVVVASSAQAAAPVLKEASLLVPHRAIYDVELGNAGEAAAISAIAGRLVFEFTGSVCEGFTQNLRFVMNITNRDGQTTVSDLRSSTWEEADGSRFRFSNSAFDNEQAGDASAGNASRGTTAIEVVLDKPRQAKVSLSSAVLFPVQHTIAVLAAARAAKPLMSADLYDGSEKGEKVMFTNTVIGRADAASGVAIPGIAAKSAELLKGQRSWPITIAYFATGSAEGTGAADHEMTFRLFENGVIRELSIDYGTLSVQGKLAEIEFYTPTVCTP